MPHQPETPIYDDAAWDSLTPLQEKVWDLCDEAGFNEDECIEVGRLIEQIEARVQSRADNEAERIGQARVEEDLTRDAAGLTQSEARRLAKRLDDEEASVLNLLADAVDEERWAQRFGREDNDQPPTIFLNSNLR